MRRLNVKNELNNVRLILVVYSLGVSVEVEEEKNMFKTVKIE